MFSQLPTDDSLMISGHWILHKLNTLRQLGILKSATYWSHLCNIFRTRKIHPQQNIHSKRAFLKKILAWVEFRQIWKLSRTHYISE